jgi:rhomboid family GlyGly-CTERM serine protease
MGLIKSKPEAGIARAAGAWQVPAVVLIVATLLLLGGDTTREWLRFERDAIAGGEVWRLVTGHLVHLGWSHFLLDAVGLVLVWYLVGDGFRAAGWAIIAVTSAGAIDAGFWYVNPELQWYVGLSGVLHGILAAGIVVSLQRPRIELIALGFLLLAKLGWEQLYGPLPGSEGGSGGPVVVAAHLYGAMSGGLAGLLALVIRVRTATQI